MSIRVLAVSLSATHRFSKAVVDAVTLVAGQGVEGDAHCGATVQHRSRVARDPTQPNLRQVHLIHSELFAELSAKGFELQPGALGENITTAGVDLLGLPVDTLLHIGEHAVLKLTGLRNPCGQIDQFQPGLLGAVLDKSPEGRLIRKTGVMSVVLAGGTVRPGDAIRVALPAAPHQALERI